MSRTTLLLLITLPACEPTSASQRDPLAESQHDPHATPASASQRGPLAEAPRDPHATPSSASHLDPLAEAPRDPHATPSSASHLDLHADPARKWWHRDPIDEPVTAPPRRFPVGNETRHDLFAEALAGRGGALLGVGGDHCYTLMALADVERAFLLDHDPQVIALHHELGARILAAPAPAAFLTALASPPALPSWPVITAHLERVAARPGTWLSEPVLYARSRALWQAGAVHPVVGDLTGALALPSIAVAVRSRALEFTVVYLSNAEETIDARATLLRNLAALPRASDGLLLRTFFVADSPAADGLWSYQTHTLADLLAPAPAPPQTIAALIADARARGVLRIDPHEPGLSAIGR